MSVHDRTTHPLDYPIWTALTTTQQALAEGDARAAQGRFSRETWDGAIADIPAFQQLIISRQGGSGLLTDDDRRRLNGGVRDVVQKMGSISSSSRRITPMIWLRRRKVSRLSGLAIRSR